MFTNIQIKASPPVDMKILHLTNRSCGGGVVLLVGEPALGGQLHGGLPPPRDLGLDERRLLLHRDPAVAELPLRDRRNGRRGRGRSGGGRLRREGGRRRRRFGRAPLVRGQRHSWKLIGR